MADSPLSDDSLSSIGASTEPLPTSEGPAPDHIDDSRSPPPVLPTTSSTRPKARHGTTFKKTSRQSGHESDSTLTEQSSSEGNGDEADDDDDEDDDPGQPTPRAKSSVRTAVIPDDEEDEPPTSMTKLSSLPDDLSELSSPAPSEKNEDEVSVRAKSPSLKASSPKPIEEDIHKDDSGRPSSAEPTPATPRNKVHPLEDDVENEALSPPSDDHEEAAEERRRAIAAAKRGSTRGRGGRGRGGRGRGRGSKKAGSARSEADVGDADDLSDAEVVPDAANGPPLSTSKRGKATRGRGTRGKRGGRSAASMGTVDRQRSPSIKSEREDQPARELDPEVDEAVQHEGHDRQIIDVHPDGNAPDEDADATTPKAIEEGEGTVGEENAVTAAEDMEAEHVENSAMDVDGELEAAVEEEKVQPKKRGGKKGKKGAKGKDKAAVAADGEDEEAGTPAASDQEAGESCSGVTECFDSNLCILLHPGLDQDEMQSRKRLEAMEELTKIEVAFATLRNRLYTERMSEVEKERIGVETGTHPELIHLNRLIELRRKTKLDMAKKLLDGLCVGYEKRLIEAEHTVWQAWANGRNDLRSSMFVEAMGKRRKLEREKRQLDRPKENTLTTLLAPRPLPAIPLHLHRRLGFDAEPLTVNEILWSVRNGDARSDSAVSGLDENTARSDLEHMGLRKPVPVLAPAAPFSAPTTSKAPAMASAAPPVNGYPYSLPAMQYSHLPPPPPPSSLQQPLPPPSYLAGYGGPPPPAPAPPSQRPSTVLDYAASMYPPPNAFGSSPFVPSDKASGAPWQSATDDARRRTRTPSGNHNLFADSLDHVARHRERSHDGGQQLGNRPSLDDHMAQARSPKHHRSGHASGAGSSAPPAPPFMHIPSFRDLQAATGAPAPHGSRAGQSDGYPRFDHKDPPTHYGHSPASAATHEPMRAT
ncbi:hypothetical protein OIV83_006274 [Microbotryomycetes sp. JL201]|nr:hypothetical protein OIV83_006274 [Microbotryomycetes sp. JL201]